MHRSKRRAWVVNKLFDHLVSVAAYSSTASARSKNVSGIVRPMSFAVVRLMTSSNNIEALSKLRPTLVNSGSSGQPK